MKMGALILAGGASRRMMGPNKAFLTLDGHAFVRRVMAQLEQFDECLLSVSEPEPYESLGLPIVRDAYPGCGPMGGICSALELCKSDALLVVCCDMPLFTGELAEYLAGYLCGDYDAFVVASRDGRLHPLCGIYRTSCIDAMQGMIKEGNLRMHALIETVRTKVISLRHSAFSDAVLCNVNTPQEYAALTRVPDARVVAVCGLKNSGKTTLLTGVIPVLKARGLRVGVIKHDGHDFEPDLPGSDSYRMGKAGADKTAVYSAHKSMHVNWSHGPNVQELLDAFCDMDVVLLEGGKHTAFPKILMTRQGLPDFFACDGNYLAICAEEPVECGVKRIRPDDFEGVADCIVHYLSSL